MDSESRKPSKKLAEFYSTPQAKRLEAKIDSCQLRNLWFSASGTIVGLALRLRYKSFIPLYLLVVSGVLADIANGKFNVCTHLHQDFLKARARYVRGEDIDDC